MPEFHYKLFADYFQFYLQDEQAAGDLSDSWSPDAVKNLLALAPGTIGVGTVRNMTVPVTVEIRETEPSRDDFNSWDHINECSIDVLSGWLVIAGCTDYFPDASRLSVEPGCYRARIYYGELDSLSEDQLEGNDHYKITLWQAENAEPRVMKQR
jgi:hypothetical protein